MLKSLNLNDTTLSKLLNTVEQGVSSTSKGIAAPPCSSSSRAIGAHTKNGQKPADRGRFGPWGRPGRKGPHIGRTFPRNLTVRAKTTTSLLEFGARHFKAIIGALPGFTVDHPESCPRTSRSGEPACRRSPDQGRVRNASCNTCSTSPKTSEIVNPKGWRSPCQSNRWKSRLNLRAHFLDGMHHSP